jgi:hypothetical protein
MSKSKILIASLVTSRISFIQFAILFCEYHHQCHWQWGDLVDLSVCWSAVPLPGTEFARMLLNYWVASAMKLRIGHWARNFCVTYRFTSRYWAMCLIMQIEMNSRRRISVYTVKMAEFGTEGILIVSLPKVEKFQNERHTESGTWARNQMSAESWTSLSRVSHSACHIWRCSCTFCEIWTFFASGFTVWDCSFRPFACSGYLYLLCYFSLSLLCPMVIRSFFSLDVSRCFVFLWAYLHLRCIWQPFTVVFSWFWVCFRRLTALAFPWRCLSFSPFILLTAAFDRVSPV